VDPLAFTLQAAFFVVFAISVWRWVTRPGPLELAVAGVFAPIAALFLISYLNDAAPVLAPVLRPLLLGAFFLQPWFVVRLIGQIRPVAARVPLIVLGGGVASTVAVLVLPGAPLVILAVAVFFFAVQAGAAGRLFRDSRRRIGVARVRLATAALATALFGLAILLAGAANAAHGGTPSEESQLITRSTALVAGLGYLVAFVPPDWLRRLAYRAMAFDLVRGLVAPGPGVETGRLWADLASTARELLGARRVVILTEREGLPLATAGEPLDVPEPVRPAEEPAGPLAARLGRALAAKPAIVSKVEVALRDATPSPRARSQAAPRHEHLVAEVEGRPLFAEDDVALLSILGALTARAVDREEALIALGQARMAVEESAAIKASENRFRALLEADPNAILALDEHEAIVWATRQAGALFGTDATSLVGKTLAELIAVPHELIAVSGGPGRSGQDRTVLRADATGRRADGTHFPAEVARTSVRMNGQLFELAVISDVSWRQEAAQIRDRFLGVLSHELRTPVTSIYGGTQLLLNRGDRLDEGTRRELLVSVAAESERLQRMIENLVALARIERGEEYSTGRPVLIDRVIRDLIRRERELWPGVAIRLDVPVPVQMVMADEDYVGQVIRNLLSNAAKYGGEAATISVEIRDADDEVEVLVKDDGPGIADEEADKLFSLYYRSAHSTAVAAGAGIGLFICRELVTLMGGRIWARSRPEGGAEFGFSLPVYVEEPEPSSAARPEEKAGDGPRAEAIAAGRPRRAGVRRAAARSER
jgi:PAS domain S-box-containing protein